MNLTPFTARERSEFLLQGIKGEADPAGHCPNPRSGHRVVASGRKCRAPAPSDGSRHVRGAEFVSVHPGRQRPLAPRFSSYVVLGRGSAPAPATFPIPPLAVD